MSTQTKAGVDQFIFIIEDDDLFRETFADALTIQGIRVDGARTGADALAELARKKPALIISDVQLPDYHGFELCRAIKKIPALKDTPVVFLSAAAAYNDPRDKAEGLLAGAALFLSKPITPERLLKELEPLLRSR